MIGESRNAPTSWERGMDMTSSSRHLHCRLCEPRTWRQRRMFQRRWVVAISAQLSTGGRGRGRGRGVQPDSSSSTHKDGKGVFVIDVGTSATKTAIVLPSGGVIGMVSRPYVDKKTNPSASDGDRSGASCVTMSIEQDPYEWWRATVDAAQETMTHLHNTRVDIDIVGISVSGQMQDIILLGEKDDSSPANVIRPAILYSDTRASAETSTIEQQIDVRKLMNYKGAASCLAKLLWLKNNESDNLEMASEILFGAHSFIAYCLCAPQGGVAREAVTGSGQLITNCYNTIDYTTASTTGCLSKTSPEARSTESDNDELDWDWHFNAFDQIGLSSIKGKLPVIKNYDHQLGVICDKCEKCSLPEPFKAMRGKPVFAGAGDVGTLTLGALGPPVTQSMMLSSSYIYIGTSGWIAITTKGESIQKEDTDAGVFKLLHPMQDEPVDCNNKQCNLIIASSMVTAGGAAAFARKVLDFDSFEEFDAAANMSKPGSNGVIFLPHLSGERSPFLDPKARGMWCGLSLKTSRSDLARSVLEGIAFNYRALYEKLQDSQDFRASASQYIPITGGGSRSAIFVQIIADILQVPLIALSNEGEVGAKGIAACSFQKLGLWAPNQFYPSLSHNSSSVHTGSENHENLFQPSVDEKVIELYERRYKSFKQLHLAVKATGLYERDGN